MIFVLSILQRISYLLTTCISILYIKFMLNTHRFLLRSYRFFFRVCCYVLFLVGLQSCGNIPTTFALPEFSSTVTFPLYDSTVTLNDFIGNDSTFLRKDTQGNLFIEETRQITPVGIGDSLRIDAQTISYTTTLNNQTGVLSSVENLGTLFTPLPALFPGLNLPNAGTIPIFPGTPPQGVLTAPMPVQWSNSIGYVIMESGTFIIRITNQLPVDITLRPVGSESLPGLRINTGTSRLYIPASSNQTLIRANATTTLSFAIPRGVRFQAGMTVEAQLSANSATNLSYTEQNGLLFSFGLQNPLIQQADAEIAPLSLSFPLTIPLGFGVRLTGAQLRNILAQMSLNNGFPLGGVATITTPQLVHATTGQPFSQQVTIAPRQNNQQIRIQTPLGQIFTLRPTTSDLNGVMDSVRIVLTMDIPRTRAVVNGTDALSVSGSLARTQLLNAQGVSIRNLNVNTRSVVNFTLSDQVSRFRFTDLSLQATQVFLSIANGTGIAANLIGTARFIGTNNTTLDNLPIPQQTIRAANRTGSPAVTDIIVNQRGLQLREIPRQAEFSATITPRDTAFSVTSADSISGTARIRIPIFMRVIGGSFSNTFTMNTQDLRTVEKNIDSLTLRLEVLNRIPAGITLVFRFFNSIGQQTLVLPLSGTLAVSAPPISNSRPTAPQFTSLSLSVSKANIPLILQAQQCTLELQVNTPGATQNQFVQFLTSDFIQIKAQVRASLNTKQ